MWEINEENEVKEKKDRYREKEREAERKIYRTIEREGEKEKKKVRGRERERESERKRDNKASPSVSMTQKCMAYRGTAYLKFKYTRTKVVQGKECKE